MTGVSKYIELKSLSITLFPDSISYSLAWFPSPSLGGASKRPVMHTKCQSHCVGKI